MKYWNASVLILVAGLVFFSAVRGGAQQVTRAQLARALQQCEQDLDASKRQILKLQQALKASDRVMERYQAASDSLIANLKQQLAVQNSVSSLLKLNADTLQAMVNDYGKKLNEINRLYIKELKKQTRPWFLTLNGLKGLIYGLLLGGIIGGVMAM
ncbi:MAG TPA: hypothetical protein ENJ89_07910 [Caldithrix abyssi]|uniref:Uncharacterized protein n=1 Tax=Caldithrix abyssi TaxID=187145 RepID=A0A7V5PQX6_CALAY|nr:hypothetical protein [Caldithrix abyssi]